MGIGGISIWQLLIVLAIVILLFGTKKLKGMGTDLGNAIKGFKKAVDDGDNKEVDAHVATETTDNTSTHSPASVDSTKEAKHVK